VILAQLLNHTRDKWISGQLVHLMAKDGKRYITPGKDTKPEVYNPLKEVPGIVLDALNVGMLMMSRSPAVEVERAVLKFVTRYGLLGLMTALPTTPAFMDYVGGLPAEESFPERGIHGHRPVSGSVLSL